MVEERMDHDGIDFNELKRSPVSAGRKTYETLSACLGAMHNYAFKERVVACRWAWAYWVSRSVTFFFFPIR
jgi:hypothetical protein